MKPHLLTCSEASASLGVSVSTVKRLCEGGHLRFVRTPGGHRRIPASDVAEICSRFGASPSSNPANQNSLAIASPSEFTNEIASELLTLEEAVRFDRLEETRRLLGTARLLDGLLSSSVNHASQGDGSQSAAKTPSEDRQAWIINYLKKLDELIPENELSSRIAVGGPAIDDSDSLYSKGIELTFRDCGWSAQTLPQNLSVEDFARAAVKAKASVVWVSYSTPTDTYLTQLLNRELRACLPWTMRLVIGGTALLPETRRALQFDFAADSLAHFVSYLARH